MDTSQALAAAFIGALFIAFILVVFSVPGRNHRDYRLSFSFLGGVALLSLVIFLFGGCSYTSHQKSAGNVFAYRLNKTDDPGKVDKSTYVIHWSTDPPDIFHDDCAARTMDHLPCRIWREVITHEGNHVHRDFFEVKPDDAWVTRVDELCAQNGCDFIGVEDELYGLYLEGKSPEEAFNQMIGWGYTGHA